VAENVAVVMINFLKSVEGGMSFALICL